MEAEYLSLEQVSAILPNELKLVFPIQKIHRVIYSTINGEYLPIATSKIAKNNIVYNVITDFYIDLGCKFVCFIIGKKGVVLLPIDILKKYNKFSGWKALTNKGRQYWVRGKVKDSLIIFTNYNDPQENISANKYFIPFKEEFSDKR